MDRNRAHNQLSAEATAHFQEGINLILSRWAALQTFVEQEWGGRDSRLKALQLSDHIFSWFTKSRDLLYIEDLEDMLDDYMVSLNTDVDDGSIEEIAEKLMIMHEECLESNFGSVRRLKETNPPQISASHPIQASSDDDDDDEEENDEGMDDASVMEVDAPQCQAILQPDRVVKAQSSNGTPEMDDGGWTVVTNRRPKGKKM